MAFWCGRRISLTSHLCGAQGNNANVLMTQDPATTTDPVRPPPTLRPFDAVRPESPMLMALLCFANRVAVCVFGGEAWPGRRQRGGSQHVPLCGEPATALSVLLLGTRYAQITTTLYAFEVTHLCCDDSEQRIPIRSLCWSTPFCMCATTTPSAAARNAHRQSYEHWEWNYYLWKPVGWASR